MSLPVISARQEKQLQRFYQRAQKHYGSNYEGHQIFLQHAAFPMLFSPDLLYQIWFNFRLYPLRGTLSQSAKLPNMVVSDLILSGLCQEVGFELFQINPKLRLYLLAQLQEDKRFGHPRVQSLAQFLHQYSHQVQLQNADPRLQEIHQQLSMASLHPRHAAQEIGRSLQKAMLSNEAMEQMRLTKLLEMLAGQDDAFESLLNFSQQLKGELTGREKITHDTESVANLVITEEADQDTILKLEVPERLRSKLKTFRDTDREAWTEAIRRIEAARAQGLKRLSLNKLGLTRLPEQLWDLSELEELGLQRNQLSEIPQGIAKLQKLKNLNLSYNPLQTLPNSFYALNNLKKLLIHHADLDEIPPPLLLMEHLTHLDVGNNHISQLPEELTYLSGIKRLYLNDNQLEEIPEIIGRFERLEILQLQNNRIRRLPEVLQNLEGLKENAQKSPWQNGLRLEGNPVVEDLNPRWLDAQPHDLLAQLFNPEIPAEEGDFTGTPPPAESEAVEAENYYNDFHQNEQEGGRRLYALLIGIDRYGEGIEPLEGCENDVRAMQDFLRRQLNFNGHSYQIMTLLNEKATKENVERSIEELLSRAGEGEEVLFYFAGYGDIDESVLLQKLPFQDPLRKLVLFIEGDFFFSDFSNGEIGDLVRQMDRQGALLSIVVDAGYAAQKGASETNTKGRHLRTIDLPARIEENPNPFDQRPIDTEMPFFEFYAAKTRNTSTEMLLGEEMRGVFTYSLIESLRQKKGEHNIREIQADIQNRMSLRAASPDPDFYIEHWNREDEPQFLGGMLAHLGASYEIRFVPEQSAWRLDAGYRDGLRSRHPVTGEMSLFDVFEEGVPPEAMAEGQGQIGQVGAETVRARSSWVAPLLKFSLNPEIKYVARLNRLPIERLRYFVDEPSFLESELPSFPKELENYLETDRERESQLYLLAEGDPKRANYVLKAEGQKVSLNHKRDLNRPILLPNLFNEFRQNPYARMQRELVHLSKWENILNLSNPNSRIDEKELGLELISTRDDSPIPIDSNAFVHDVISPQQIRIRVHNQSTQGLYFGLLYLSADLAVSPIPMSEGGSFLEAGQSIMAIDGETATLNFSRRQQEMGQTEATDYFILIASSDPFRPQVLEMLDIDRQSERQPERNIVNWTNTHSLLFDESEGRYQDWNTRLYRVNMSFNPTVE